MSWSRWQTIVAETQAVAPLTTASPVSPPAPEPATPFELALSAAQVDRTEDGAILLIRAPTPETALAAYCAAAATAMACQPLEIVQLRPPHPDGRVGLLRNFNDLSRSGAVHIRLDRATRRWTIGDGAQEIVRVDGTLYESAPPKISTAGYQ